MIKATCNTCGGTFHLNDALAGRRAKCKRCESIFTVPDPVPFADDDGLLKLTREKGTTYPVEAASGLPQAEAVAREETGRAPRPDRDVIHAPTRSFWADAGISLVIPFTMPSIILFGIVALLMVVQSFLGLAGCFGLLGILVIYGWLCAYYFLIVQSTCAGEDDLPRFEVEGWFEGIILPAVRYIGAAFWVGLPLLAWSFVIHRWDILPGQGDAVVRLGLLGIGLFMWPMTILTIALQGFSLDVLRYDRQFLTIGRSFVPYVAICLIVAALTFLSFLVAGGGRHLGISELGGSLAVKGLVIVLNAYVSLITMRLIGLFYRHNKRRFAWLAE